MAENEQERRLDAAEYEIRRAMAELQSISGDSRHTQLRRQLAAQEVALGVGILALTREWRRLELRRNGAGYEEAPELPPERLSDAWTPAAFRRDG